MVVTVNWDKEKVEAEICFVYGTFITKTTFILQYYLHRVIIICHLHVSCITHCRNSCMTKCSFFNTKQQETRADVMIYVSPQQNRVIYS